MSVHCNTRSCSLLKTVLGKIGDWDQAYCTTYKTHAMATCHRGAGCPLDRGLDILDPEHADIDNESPHSSDGTVILGGPEALGHPEDPVYDNQEKLTALTREINDLHQRVVAREGQPVKTLKCIQHELQNLLLAIHQPQPPAPVEPLREVIWQYTDTLCSMQKQYNLSNSLLQDIPVFNEHDSTRFENWLTDIEMAADLTSQSRSRLVKVKSQGLTCTLVTEAITSDKSCNEIRDLLRLKLCNADIHTYTHDSWRSSSEKRSLSQCMYIGSRQKLKSVTSQMTWLQSGYSSRV